MTINHDNLDATLQACAEFIAQSGRGPEDPRMPVAFAIARYLQLPGWPAAPRYRDIHVDDIEHGRSDGGLQDPVA